MWAMHVAIKRRSLMKRLFWFHFTAAAILVGAFAASPSVVAPAPQASSSSFSPNAPATIEPDGTLDLPFDAGNFTNGQVASSVLQPDGKVLIGGQFSKVHGV